jgi:hypothetical protein
MAVDLTGINNENEFYTNHYLSAIFENDIKDVLSRWKQGEEDGTRSPYAQIRTICNDYFSFSNSFEKEKTLEGRLKLQREWLQLFLPALGYDINPQFKTLDAGFDIPILFESKKSNGAPDMWIIESINLYGEDQDPLSLSFCKEQFQTREMTKDLEGITLDTVITKFVFGMEEPPRWILVINNSQVMLLDRSKWNEKRMIRFDIPEILGRKEDSTLKSTAALLHRESICPYDGIPLLDTLDENSHKNAFSVSEDLKYALREAIELIGNEAIYYLQEVRRKGVFSGEEKVDAEELTRECLRYMYRLLFILYIEARPELGYIPMKSDAYRLGYSFEALRDLEFVKLNSEESKNGYYLNESIKLLFNLIYNGVTEYQKQGEFAHGKGVGQSLFEIPSLKTHLFDPERTPILNKVKFRNIILQRVIELMSLSRQGGRNNRLGRISYAQLGINQLGAVYEALLSYQGFFAETDLYELKKAGETHDELKNAYFVRPEDLGKYTDDEKVYNNDGTLKKYEKGTFIYRLAGRDREKSASYYTPEVLTKCLVKYALRELLKDKTADDILKLTVCEPAMGSAAFLNEAINQLAEAYLERKQRELGERIAHDEYTHERQKVKMYLADNNVFGVDLNPVAVELAEVSLWLNTISKQNFVPWFGMQLVCGNSLIGARRQVFNKMLFRRENRIDSLWLGDVPERVMPNEERNEDMVYHFLLPDKGMADYKDKVIKQLAGERIKEINNWRNDFAKEFTKREVRTLQALSDTIDKLWSKHTEQQRDMRERTTDIFAVWGQHQSVESRDNTGTRWKDKVFEQELLSKQVKNSSPYRRLKLVMDYWCSLWFWPIEKSDLLPSRDEYFLDLSLILEGNPVAVTHADEEQLLLFPDTMSKQMQLEFINEIGLVDVDKLCSEVERLSLVQELANKYRFLHWELEFADLFEDKEGFDLVLGNPPWLKVRWNEGGILSDSEPLFDIRKFSANKLTTLRRDSFKKYSTLIENYISEYSGVEGTQNFLNGMQNYSVLQGMQSNLFKCFLPQSWMITSSEGVQGLLHPEGVYDDPKGGVFRKTIYPRLKCHFQFQNELNLFSDIDHHNKFSINIYSNSLSDSFVSISNIFHPLTIDQSFNYNGIGSCEGIKDVNNNWNVNGHKDRILNISEKELKLFSSLYDSLGADPHEARFPALHSKLLLLVLEKFVDYPQRLRDLNGEYFPTVCFDETNAQNDGTIKRHTVFPDNAEKLIISGPHFYVAQPFYKTPRAECKLNADYDVLDLTSIANDYLPRTNYMPACSEEVFQKRIPCVSWIEKGEGHTKKVTEYYRYVNRKMLSQSGERTLVSAILPLECTHILTCFSIAFQKKENLLSYSASTASIPFDFFVKATGKATLLGDIAINLPLIQTTNHLYKYLKMRYLSIICITSHFAVLWEGMFDEEFCSDSFTKENVRLNKGLFSNLTPHWQRNNAMRHDYERRQALVEIDVLVAMELDLTIDELKTIYRIQFPVMQQYEKDTYYDATGRIVWTNSKGLTGVGLKNRKEWNEIKDMKDGTVEKKVIDDTLPGGPRERTIAYHAPFDRCDREKDYEIAWKEFERRFKDKEGTT